MFGVPPTPRRRSTPHEVLPPHLPAYGSRSAALPTRHVGDTTSARASAARRNPWLLPSSQVRAVAHEAGEAASAARGLRGWPRGQAGCEEGCAFGRAAGLRCGVGRAASGRARGDTDERGGGAWQALSGLGAGGAAGVGVGADLRDRPRFRRADERSRDTEPCTAARLFCYSACKREAVADGAWPVRYHLSSFAAGSPLGAQLGAIQGSDSWPITRHATSYLEAFGRTRRAPTL
jgi:hypothetical protein